VGEKTGRGRRLAKIAAFNLVIVIVLVAGLEIVLRLTHPPAPEEVREPVRLNLFEKAADADGRAMYQNRLADPENIPRGGFSLQLGDGRVFTVEEPFADTPFAATKPADTFRVFLLGSSPVYSKWWDGADLDLAAAIQTKWNAGREAPKMEAINCANKAFDLDSMVAMLGEVVRFDADLVLVYLGNVSPTINFEDDRELIFSAGFRNPVLRLVARSRIFKDLLAPVVFPRGQEQGRRDLMTGARTFGPADARVLAEARRNLGEITRRKVAVTIQDMLAVSRAAETPLAFYTLASNLTAPPLLPPGDEAVDPKEARVRELLDSRPGLDAEAALIEALQIAPNHPMALFRMGMLLKSRSMPTKAAEYLQAAMRASQSERMDFVINPELRAAEVRLIDIRPALEIATGSDRQFYQDHWHFSQVGMDRIAAATAEWIERQGLVRK
jgi:hypothetical protein